MVERACKGAGAGGLTMEVTGRAADDEPRLERDEVRGRRGGDDEVREPSLRAAQTSCSFSLRLMKRSSSSCSSSRFSSGRRCMSSWLISRERYWSTASWLDLAKRDCLLPMVSGCRAGFLVDRVSRLVKRRFNKRRAVLVVMMFV